MRWVIGVVALWPLVAAAETVYVTDNLRLGLYQAANSNDPAIRTVESGQALEILSRDLNYAHVQLPDGAQGYVKAAYLVDDKPAKLIVAETKAESDRLRSELETLHQQFARPAATMASLEQEVAELKENLVGTQARITQLDTQNAGLRGRQSQYKYSLPLQWVAGALGVCLVGGFLFGLWWVDQRSRRRHGGIRIY